MATQRSEFLFLIFLPLWRRPEIAELSSSIQEAANLCVQLQEEEVSI
jgi:hypothetical protein